jgi:DNA polymerase-1
MDQASFTVQFLGESYPSYYIKDKSDAVRALEKLIKKDVLFGIDTETMALPEYRSIGKAALSPHLSRVRLLQVFDGKSCVVFDMLYIDNVQIFKEFLESKRFIAHNAVFDLQRFMHEFGVIDMQIGCTMILAKILFHATYPDDEGLSASLENLIREVFKCEVSKENQASNWGATELTFEQIQYSALDPLYCLKLAEKLAPGLTRFGLEKTYQLLKKAQHPVASLELNGILLDVDKHRVSVGIWRDKLYAAKNDLLALTGLEKITSHTIADYLYNTLPKETLSIWPVTASGKLSTDANVFSEFSYLDIVAPFSEFQKRSVLTSTFGSKLISGVNPATGRIHCRFDLTGARTGRLSCSRPNMQNIPRSPDKEYKELHTDEPDLRSNFVARAGCSLVGADFNQVEIRAAAELSRDENMLNAYRHGLDIHAITASNISGKRIEDVSKEDRRRAKAISFGALYGIGSKKLSSYAKKSYKADISPADSSGILRDWRELYSGYAEWMQERVRETQKTLSSRTPLGKLRRLASDNTFGSAANTPIQGGSAEAMIASLVIIYDKIKGNDGIRLVNCVHDEVILEVEKGYEGEAKKILEESMTDGFLFVFPGGITKGLVEAKVGDSWASAK